MLRFLPLAFSLISLPFTFSPWPHVAITGFGLDLKILMCKGLRYSRFVSVMLYHQESFCSAPNSSCMTVTPNIQPHRNIGEEQEVLQLCKMWAKGLKDLTDYTQVKQKELVLLWRQKKHQRSKKISKPTIKIWAHAADWMKPVYT